MFSHEMSVNSDKPRTFMLRDILINELDIGIILPDSLIQYSSSAHQLAFIYHFIDYIIVIIRNSYTQ